MYPDSDEGNEDEEAKPAAARLTAQGGYAHLDATRRKISIANRGNTPWNKGRNRSANDRAKIAVGVRARNRTILLAKLQDIGMTEEEWMSKKKELHVLRNKLFNTKKRRRLLVEEREQKMKQKEEPRKKAKAAMTEFIAELKLEEVTIAIFISLTKRSRTNLTMFSPALIAVALGMTKENDEQLIRKEVSESRQPTTHDFLNPAIMWAKLQLDDQQFETEKLNQMQSINSNIHENVNLNDEVKVPINRADTRLFCANNGGPLGLLCCEVCATQYSDYLSSTLDELETQRGALIESDTNELLTFIASSKVRLADSIHAERSTRKKHQNVK
jgi:hypothetical protein